MSLLWITSSAFAASSAKGVGQLRLQSSEYISSGQTYFRDGAEGSNNSISLGVDTDLRWRNFSSKLNVRDEYSGTERWNYLNILDAHVAWHPARETSLVAGRKLDRWTEWESDWRQGLFEPRYMQNRLRPEFAGLIGVFLSQNSGPVSVTAGFLPFHVPDLGAHFSVRDNKFVSRNPWFHPPAEQFVFQGQADEIRYSLEKPGAEEVALNPGGVAKAEFKGLKNYLGRLSVAYKPMPQMLLGFPSRNRVVVTAQEVYMNVRVVPRLVYHTIFSHDSVAKFGVWTMTGSVAREVPDKAEAPDDFTAQQAKPAWISSLSVSRPLETEGPYAARVRLGYLKIQGGDVPDRGEFATARTLFERRYQFTDAYLLALNKPWRGFTFFPIDSELRVIYDRLQNGGVVSFNTSVNFTRELRADFEVDILGLAAGPAEVGDGFLAMYRANDRVGLGLSYVY